MKITDKTTLGELAIERARLGITKITASTFTSTHTTRLCHEVHVMHGNDPSRGITHGLTLIGMGFSFVEALNDAFAAVDAVLARGLAEPSTRFLDDPLLISVSSIARAYQDEKPHRAPCKDLDDSGACYDELRQRTTPQDQENAVDETTLGCRDQCRDRDACRRGRRGRLGAR